MLIARTADSSWYLGGLAYMLLDHLHTARVRR